jgi:hypothetical protein
VHPRHPEGGSCTHRSTGYTMTQPVHCFLAPGDSGQQQVIINQGCLVPSPRNNAPCLTATVQQQAQADTLGSLGAAALNHTYAIGTFRNSIAMPRSKYPQ